MGRSLSGALLKGVGTVVLVLLVLSVIGTVISAVRGFVAAVVSLGITVTVLSAVVLAAIGLVSLLGDGDSSGTPTGKHWTSTAGRRTWNSRTAGGNGFPETGTAVTGSAAGQE